MEELKVIKERQDLSMFTFEAENEIEEKTGLKKIDLYMLGETNEEIIETIKDNFDYVQVERRMDAKRFLTDDEINEARSRNLEIIENILPDEKDIFADVEMKAKKEIREAKAVVNSFITESETLGKYVRNGFEDIIIKSKDVFRIVHKGYFIYLLIVDGSALRDRNHLTPEFTRTVRHSDIPTLWLEEVDSSLPFKREKLLFVKKPIEREKFKLAIDSLISPEAPKKARPGSAGAREGKEQIKGKQSELEFIELEDVVSEKPLPRKSGKQAKKSK